MSKAFFILNPWCQREEKQELRSRIASPVISCRYIRLPASELRLSFYFRSCHGFHLLLPAIMCWVPQSIEQQTHGNPKSVRLISGVLVAIVARWKKNKNFLFSGFDAIKNPAAVTKWRLHLLLWRNGTWSVDHVEIMQILLSPFLFSFLLSMFSFTAIASIALLEVWPTCNNFLRDLHNPNRLLHDWKLWSSAQFLLDHADFPLPRKS
jgi:hypothetical protein